MLLTFARTFASSNSAKVLTAKAGKTGNQLNGRFELDRLWEPEELGGEVIQIPSREIEMMEDPQRSLMHLMGSPPGPSEMERPPGREIASGLQIGPV